MTQASYDIIIPGSVRQDKRLGLFEQVLYGEIRGLCRLSGFCWASSTFLAGRMRADNRSIRRWLSKLEECKHIRIEHGEATDIPGATKNTRKITLIEGRTVQSVCRTLQSYTRTPRSACRTGQSAQGRTPESAPTAGIRKNTIKTTTTTCKNQRPASSIQRIEKKNDDDGVDFSKIPQKIKQRFGVKKTLQRFFEKCRGDTVLMMKYLDAADKSGARNPVGLAVRMADDYGGEGPPGIRCAYCDKPNKGGPRWEGKEIPMCEDHIKQYVKLRDAGGQKHLAMLNSGLKRLAG